MKCEICGAGIPEGATLHRQNEKGVKGVWRCTKHNLLPVDPIIQEIIDLLEPRCQATQ